MGTHHTSANAAPPFEFDAIFAERAASSTSLSKMARRSGIHLHLVYYENRKRRHFGPNTAAVLGPCHCDGD